MSRNPFHALFDWIEENRGRVCFILGFLLGTVFFVGAAFHFKDQADDWKSKAEWLLEVHSK